MYRGSKTSGASVLDELRTIHGSKSSQTPPLPPLRVPSSITTPSSGSRAPPGALRKETHSVQPSFNIPKMVVQCVSSCYVLAAIDHISLCKKHMNALKRMGHLETLCNGALTSVEIFEELNGGLVEGVAELEGDAELQQLRRFANGSDDLVLHAVP